MDSVRAANVNRVEPFAFAVCEGSRRGGLSFVYGRRSMVGDMIDRKIFKD